MREATTHSNTIHNLIASADAFCFPHCEYPKSLIHEESVTSRLTRNLLGMRLKGPPPYYTSILGS
jgi:hypothetical protein